MASDEKVVPTDTIGTMGLPADSTNVARNNTRQTPLNHFSISASNLDAVTKWYTSIVNFQQIGTTIHTKRSEDLNNPIFLIYPPELERCAIRLSLHGKRSRV
ncbi:hypothetical protein BDV19DRAFT_362294 [Aspergillus venezuelensis]